MSDLLNNRYEEYLSRGPKPKNSSSNPLNLFDDSNQEDDAWVLVAKDLLTQSE